jgi:hypothetical protein
MSDSGYPALSGVTIDRALINEIRDDEELTSMARIIESAQREAWFQGFGSDWDKARFSAYMLRKAGFGAAAAPQSTSEQEERKEHHVPG